MKKQLFEKFITENLDSAYRFAYTYTKNQHDAEDVVSESIIKALRSVESLRSPQYMKTWFYRIIANTAYSYLKMRNRFEDRGEAEEIIGTLPAEDDYSWVDLMSIIDGLDVKYREIIVLRFLEGMQINEIASVTALSESTVKTRLYRALELLKKDMEGEKA